MILKLLKFLYKVKTMPCPCGGQIRHHLTWADDDYYACDRCRKEVTEAVFNVWAK